MDSHRFDLKEPAEVSPSEREAIALVRGIGVYRCATPAAGEGNRVDLENFGDKFYEMLVDKEFSVRWYSIGKDPKRMKVFAYFFSLFRGLSSFNRMFVFDCRFLLYFFNSKKVQLKSQNNRNKKMENFRFIRSEK